MNTTDTRLAYVTTKLSDTGVVFIVDGDASTREALRELVHSEGWDVETSPSAEAFLARPKCTTPCCLLVEQNLPGSSGLDLQGLLRDRPEMPVVFMSDQPDAPAIVRAMKAGALEFLTKPVGSDLLLDVVEDAMRRSREALRKQAQIGELRRRYALLSPREREVMQRVVAGRMNKQTGGDLGITEITVKAHRGQAMRKMGARSLAELVLMSESLSRSTSMESTEGDDSIHRREAVPPRTPAARKSAQSDYAITPHRYASDGLSADLLMGLRSVAATVIEANNPVSGGRRAQQAIAGL